MKSEKDFVSKEDLEKELKNFKAFALQRSMVDISVGMILATAFGKVIAAISSNLIMPLSGIFFDPDKESWRNYVWVITPSIKIETGAFFGSLIDFLLTALLLYILYIKLAKPILFPDDPPKTD